MTKCKCNVMWLCWLRWLKCMWFDFSLKLSTQSVRLNSSWEASSVSQRWRRSYNHCTEGGRGAEEADDEGEAGGDEQTHLSSFTHNQRHGGDDESQWCLLSEGMISDDWLIDWLSCWWSMVCLFCRSFQSQWKGEWSAGVSGLSASDPKPLQFWSSMFFQSPDLITAGSTDAFWSFDSCATLLGQPALQSLEEDAGHCPEQWVWLQKIWARIHTHWKWCNIDRFQHYVWRSRSSTAPNQQLALRKENKSQVKVQILWESKWPTTYLNKSTILNCTQVLKR